MATSAGRLPPDPQACPVWKLVRSSACSGAAGKGGTDSAAPRVQALRSVNPMAIFNRSTLVDTAANRCFQGFNLYNIRLASWPPKLSRRRVKADKRASRIRKCEELAPRNWPFLHLHD